jgi:hypothetical protein
MVHGQGHISTQKMLVIDDTELKLASSFMTENCASAVILFNISYSVQLEPCKSCPLQTSFYNALHFYMIATQILERCTRLRRRLSYILRWRTTWLCYLYSHFFARQAKVQRLPWVTGSKLLSSKLWRTHERHNLTWQDDFPATAA